MKEDEFCFGHFTSDVVRRHLGRQTKETTGAIEVLQVQREL